MNFDSIKKIHFIGIGGIGISALARLMLFDKKEVSGTNNHESRETLDPLRAQGVSISLDTDPNVLPEADCYIYSDAWIENFPAVVRAARATGKPTLSYFEALGAIANQYYLIAVAGTHGKTTTTAMIIDVLEEAGLDPTAVVGSLRAKTGSNFRAGKNKYFVVEADEYMRHFLNFSPDILVILNIEADHLDYYADLEAIQSAFHALARQVRDGGFVVCDTASPALAPVLRNLSVQVIDYSRFFNPLLPLLVIGMHNFQNAAAALAVAHILRIEKNSAQKALSEFTGTWRRFEYKGVMPGGAILYDDYGHHPTEVRVTVRAAREKFRDKHIIVVFHPHLYSRTKLLFDDFKKAFQDADEVVLAPIFAAREKDDGTISHTMLAEAIEAEGVSARALDTFEDIAMYLKKQDREGAVIITMGAGDIYKIGTELLARG